MQDLTTQKHDYVPKCIQRRSLIVPKPMMQCTNLPLECETVHRLSFPNPCHAIPTVSCKPKICYQKPCMPVECDTTHKLSFQPVCAQAKEIFPWAQKTRFTLPCLPVENETTYKLSYLGGRGGRYPLVVPKNNPCMITCDVGFDDRTVYNDSFLNNKVGCRPAAIRPLSTLCTPNCKMDPDTMYNLAYQGHYCVPKQRAVLPCSQPLPCGPMQDLTTQRHDFVNKQICRREPIRPQNTIIKTCLPLDCTTTANASYMCPTHFSPSISCKPTTCYQRPCCKKTYLASLFLYIYFGYVSFWFMFSARGMWHHTEVKLPTGVSVEKGVLRLGHQTSLSNALFANGHWNCAEAQLHSSRSLRVRRRHHMLCAIGRRTVPKSVHLLMANGAHQSHAIWSLGNCWYLF